MPGGNGTGPMGYGPMTGRAMGYCVGYDTPGFMNPWPRRGFGRGWGRGRGFGWGRGRGFGRGWGRGFRGDFGFMPMYEPDYQEPYKLTKEEESKMLKEEAKAVEEEQKALKQELEEIKKRIEELKKKK